MTRADVELTLRSAPVPTRETALQGIELVLKKEERKEIVLRHAKEVFSEKGYHQAKISDIIQRAGIARGTFYLYFENKRDVFESILDHLLARLEQIIHPIGLQQGDPPPSSSSSEFFAL